MTQFATHCPGSIGATASPWLWSARLGLLLLASFWAFSVPAGQPKGEGDSTLANLKAVRKESARVLNEAASADPKAKVEAVENGLDSQTGDGPLAQGEKFSKAMMLRIAQLQAQVSKEVDEAGWFELLDPVRLGGDRDLSGSTLILAKVRSAQERYGDAMHAHIDALPQLARTIVTHQVMRDMIVGNLEQNAVGMRASFDANHRYDFLALDHADKLIQWLKANPEAWGVREGRVVFASSGGQHVWDRELAAIAKCVETQNALAQQARSQATRQLEEEPQLLYPEDD